MPKVGAIADQSHCANWTIDEKFDSTAAERVGDRGEGRRPDQEQASGIISQETQNDDRCDSQNSDGECIQSLLLERHKNENTERNTTAYIQNWISKLEEDNRLVVHAAANAQRAVDLILGTSFENVDANEELTAEAVATAAVIANAQCEALAA